MDGNRNKGVSLKGKNFVFSEPPYFFCIKNSIRLPPVVFEANDAFPGGFIVFESGDIPDKAATSLFAVRAVFSCGICQGPAAAKAIGVLYERQL